ncbi:MAG: 16S rRNA (guanine(966)-N(2))-methyltransferase RsmD [Oscillospiraceae bacterium]|jgi:16S rRNA (guanine(966)-N(2))-methyltransferase RsmD|nr:16S rRNA (guanine(966)-N(2))-methyltransferase RsmD [Oscillospiraceae bacterium]
MRIISGSNRGRKLKTPPGDGIRPTGDKVKESIFNILQFDIEGRRVLDLFAGTGQLGIEALSRGAASVTFVDSSQEAITLVRENTALLQFAEPKPRIMIFASDAITYLQKTEKFDIILLDPPFASDLLVKCVRLITEKQKVEIGGLIVCEMDSSTLKTWAKDAYPGYTERSYSYGKTSLLVYTREE